jgi:alkylation response protein AidB-like acyl-CoA dehydrogenase
MGLRGTGSDSYEISGLFVPRSHVFLRTVAAPHRGVLYRIPLAAVYPIAFASVALGLTKAVLNAFLDMARNKTPQGLRPMRGSDAIQWILGHAATRLSSARTNLRQTLIDIYGRVLDCGGPDRLDRSREEQAKAGCRLKVSPFPESNSVLDVAVAR